MNKTVLSQIELSQKVLFGELEGRREWMGKCGGWGFFFWGEGAIVEIIEYSFFEENTVIFLKGHLKTFLTIMSIYFMHRLNIFLQNSILAVFLV